MFLKPKKVELFMILSDIMTYFVSIFENFLMIVKKKNNKKNKTGLLCDRAEKDQSAFVYRS